VRAKSSGGAMIVNQRHIAPTLRSSKAQFVANAAFIALFPGFFFYHTLLGTGTTSAFLGGYFSPVSLLFFLPLVTIALRKYRNQPQSASPITVYYAIFLAYFLSVIACNTIAGASRTIVINQLLCILFMINTFIMFSVIDFSSMMFRITALGSLIAMSSIAFAYSMNGVFYLGALGVAKDTDSLATYQGFARSYLVTFLPVVAFTRSLILRLLLYGFAVATLFVNTARSEFVALVFAIPIIEFYFSRKKLIFLLVVSLLFIWLNLYMDMLAAALPDNRILELLDLSHSTSANKRHHLSVHAMQTIAAHPLLGDYASYAPGYYSHNILSAWVDLGLFGFLYLTAILIVPAIPLFIREYFSGRRTGNFILGFSLACCTVLLLLTSHYFTDMLIGATLGAYAQCHYRRRYGKHRAPDVSPSPLRHADIRQAMPQHGNART
jgi:hypothetical protein